MPAEVFTGRHESLGLCFFFFFLFLIGWPIAIWFDMYLSKTNYIGAGTRQLAVYGPPRSKEVLDEGFYFFPWSESSE